MSEECEPEEDRLFALILGQLPKEVIHECGVLANNALRNLGITTKKQALKAIKNGTLSPKRVRNYGNATHKKVCLWAGAPIPRKPRKRVIRCPHCNKPI